MSWYSVILLSRVLIFGHTACAFSMVVKKDIHIIMLYIVQQ